MRALVISGGGSKGAYAGGIAQFLIEETGTHYDIFTGTSTGAILAPLLAAGRLKEIRDVYTSVGQADIFDVCPFKVTKNGNGYRTSINHLGVLSQFFRRKKTFGESNNLRSLIASTYTRTMHESIRQSSKFVIVTVANLSREVVEHKYLRDCSYEDFCDWIWISSNTIPFMSLVEKHGYEYADGGYGNLIPVQEAINLGAKEIDVIVLNPRHRPGMPSPSTNAFNLLVRGFTFMVRHIGVMDLRLALAESRYSDIKVNLIHTPYNLTDNPFIFDPEVMTKWWFEGYEYASQAFFEPRQAVS